ncbi:Rrf2-linked NADH-flavin reductase [Pantoea agglomerans 299R]|nr:NAD(P)H-binding protein [Pantoea agglomerans]ELP26664.1 Rrf2-linked NADH-flavin reductase [Pantoea agglomerans 299R]
MKIALIAPTGKIGFEIAKEAIRQGHNVTGLVRNARAVPEGLEGIELRVTDISDTAAFADAIRGVDVLASAYGAHGEHIGTLVDAAHAIVSAARAANVGRIIVVGGAASLEVAPGEKLLDAPYFPSDYYPYGLAHDKAFKIYQAATDLKWTFFSPPAEIGPGEKKGNYKIGGKILLKDAKGESRISYCDYAEAFINEIAQGNHINSITTVAYK